MRELGAREARERSTRFTCATDSLFFETLECRGPHKAQTETVLNTMKLI